jgi:glycosyltransferase involved in cell wall biosynthesis
MYRDHTTAVVVPAYNEAKLIGRVIDTMPDFVDYIVVVNDKSKDDTAEIVRKYVNQQPDRVILIDLKINQGVGGAIAEGYKWARDREVACTAVMAGDAQMDPKDLPTLLDPVVDRLADYTKGNRLFTGEAWQKIPRTRYLGNSVLSLMTKVASGYWHIADSQTGYTVANLKVLQTLILDEIYKRYGMPNDMLVKLNIYNFRVWDVPIEPVYNVGEKSGFKSLLVIPKFYFLLRRLFIYRMMQKYIIRDFHPLVFFYFFGYIFFLLGFLFGTYLFGYRVFTGPVQATSTIMAIFLIITGLQFLFFAMWFDMDYNKGLSKSSLSFPRERH